MIYLVEQSLQHLRLGVFDVLPLTVFDYLSPEDFRLLLNGTSNINITILMTYTTFNDESGKFKFVNNYLIFLFFYSLGETNERINQFKKWFWSVLEKFNSIERQDLVRLTITKKKLIFVFCRFIFGLVVLHYQHQKLVFNLNHLLPFDQLMINIYQQQIHVLVVYMFHYIHQKQY